MSASAGSPKRKPTPAEAEALIDKVEQDIGAAFGVASRITKVAMKVALKPAKETLRTVLRALVQD